MGWFKRRTHDELVFLTHTGGSRCEPGKLYVRGDDVYVITRVEATSPTRLLDGSVRGCYAVYGMKVERP